MTSARFTSDDTDELLVQGSGPRPDAVWLDGPRARVDAVVTGGGKTWKARVPLTMARWGGPELPRPSGAYALRIRAAAGAADGPPNSRPPAGRAWRPISPPHCGC